MIDPSLLPLNKLVEGHALITSFQIQIGNRMAGEVMSHSFDDMDHVSVSHFLSDAYILIEQRLYHQL
ncbi:hypothetical protein Goklo_019710 [Gossypium klotzschianum]|uniref:Uncharacterized protein n=1 Tax=Gossypium klotzschianum TaxID=34286 RepID=A0A7J8UPI2_9ROSI|nr:hypothetical protein [Gossypium klotzschianum]